MKPSESRHVHVTLSIHPVILAWLDDKAAEKGYSRSGLVTDLVRRAGGPHLEEPS